MNSKLVENCKKVKNSFKSFKNEESAYEIFKYLSCIPI